MRRIVLMAAVLSVITAACKLEFNLAADIEADATGTVTIELGFDEEAAGFFLEGTDPFEGAPPSAVTQVVERGDMTFYQTSQPFGDEAELTALMTGDEAAFESFRATFAEDLVTVEGTTAGTGGFVNEGDLEGFTSDQLAESLTAKIRITMPGRVIEHNADSVDGSTLEWELDLFGGDVEVSAQSDPTQETATDDGGSGFPVWLIALIAISIVAGVGYVLYRRNKARPVFEPNPPSTDE
jgi:hypothetical protein